MDLFIKEYTKIQQEINIGKESETVDELLFIEPPKIEENKNVIKTNSTKYVKKFIENNKDKINLKIQCHICYSSYTYFNKSKHFKTKRHLLLQSIKNNVN
jgi:hypothetical protein